MHTDDKIDNQCSRSASSADSGIVIDDPFMSHPGKHIGITTSIGYSSSKTPQTEINIENIINFANNANSETKKSPVLPEKSSTNKLSPTLSSRSTNISITSIQSGARSSTIDSDSDDYGDTNGVYTIKKLGQQTSEKLTATTDLPNIKRGDGMVLLQQRVNGTCIDNLTALSQSSSVPQVTNMAFTNSTDITIGQKNYYQGPVTIQQFLIENRIREAARNCGGADNYAFEDETYKNVQDRPQLSDAGKQRAIAGQKIKFVFNRKAVMITGLIIIVTIVLATVFVTANFKRKRLDNIGGGKVLRLVPRDEWLARPPSEPLDKLVLPVHRVIIAHTATENCSSQASCAYRTQVIQNFHMQSRHFSDIAYNFLVGGDGAVYEGRGWDQQGSHTKGYNVDSICVAFIGTFTLLEPPERQMNAAKLIIEEGVRLKKVVPNYRLYGARQLIPSESPGSALYDIIKTWPNWSSSLDN